jgi:hypothetical protein
MARRTSFAVPFACLCIPLLPGCAFFGLGAPSAPADASETTYRAAMADFSLCQTAPGGPARDAAAARVAEAAARLQAETRPTNPDHFYMTDRVAAAARFCAGMPAR